MSTADAGVGLPLVFLHGFPLSRGAGGNRSKPSNPPIESLRLTSAALGESDTAPGPASMAQYAADLHALLQRLATGPVVLISHVAKYQ
jgi:pimeloyl-ACP methyl ester carboxylesterase